MSTMHIGSNPQTYNKVALKTADLLTHGVILGRTGSGKTGATVATIEEAVLGGASAIVIDPKGDLTNLALRFPNLEADEFEPWVQPGDTGEKAAARAREGLGDNSYNVMIWKKAAPVTIYAPGKLYGGGKPVNILPSFEPPNHADSIAILRDRAASHVEAILNAIGHNADPLTDPASVFLTDAVLDAWKDGRSLPFESWPGLLSNPPAHLSEIDGMPLNQFFAKRDRMRIARSLIGFRRQANRWLEGDRLDIASLVGDSPKVSVFTLRHLNEEDRQFFCAMLLAAIVDYMYETVASDRLKLLVALDEAKGYLPPYPYNPATKGPICTLLAQGRAQGIGLLIGTQNPNDICYKALSNVGTWFVGRLRKRDCARDLETELAARGVKIEQLANIPQRTFLLLKKDNSHELTKIRWTYSFLRGPMNGDDIAKLTGGSTKTTITKKAKSGDITLCSSFSNPSSTPANVRIFFSTDGGDRWRLAKIRSPISSIATSPEGIKHAFVWDSYHDLGSVRASVMIRIETDRKWLSDAGVILVDNQKVKRGWLQKVFG